jgi:hypothetical protein
MTPGMQAAPQLELMQLSVANAVSAAAGSLLKHPSTHAWSGMPLERHVANVHCRPMRHTSLLRHWFTCAPQ